MTTVRRARLTRIGWEDDLAVETFEESFQEPEGDQVRIAVEACGVCHRDCIDRSGRFKFIQIPITPGHEAVGRVAAVGPDASDWKVGDRVGTMHRDFCGSCGPCTDGSASLCESAAALLGLMIDGGYATHMTVPQRCLFTVPEDLAAAEAAVLHCTFGTSFRGMKSSGRVDAGRHVLVTGANGGVGTAAIQVARRLGASVTAVVRDPLQEAYVTGLGATQVIVDPGDGFHKRLSGGQADVVMECVGQPTFNASLRALRPGGRLIVVGNVVQEPASVNLGLVVTKGLRIIGSSGATREDMKALLAMHAKEPFSVQIQEQVDLQEADRAQRLVKAGGLRGRIVIMGSGMTY